MGKVKKWIPWILGILALVILCCFTAISTDGAFTEAGGCFSVVFDKPFVLGADRVVVYEGDAVITITDPQSVRTVASTFLVANRTDLCGYHDSRRVEIYNGTRLVRSIRWNACCELAEIYTADAAHWVFPSSTKIGQVALSEEFLNWLNQVIEDNQ